MDGNAATSYAAHAMSEVVCIYPITPSSPMAELADSASAKGKRNVLGQVPVVYEMQSEAGAAGAVHGAAVAGCLTTTFTASQGLLLMVPNMFKMSGELMPGVINVSARTVSTHALSIFGDHSDVMLCRGTGYGMLTSSDPQEAMDMAAIAMAASIKCKVPFLHFFDGFRTSHEIQKVQVIPMETLEQLVDREALADFRRRSLNPDWPIMKGTAMNPDIWFQGSEARNPYYAEVPGVVSGVFAQFAQLTGRTYQPFEYFGAPDAETVVVLMGSGSNVAREAVEYLHGQRGERCGMLRVRLYRPFDAAAMAAALPANVKRVVVLDRTKEPGSQGEPLYQDIVGGYDQLIRAGSLQPGQRPLILGGRYGMSSKEFTPTHVKAVFDHVDKKEPATWVHGFTVGIEDDLTGTSLPILETIDSEPAGVRRAKFYGLGSDGTVSANKNSIKIIGDNSDKWVQGYFVYDSKKAGGTTVSHLRFSDDPIRSHYLITEPDFVAIHNKEFLGKYDMLEGLQEGATVLLNTDLPADQVFASFPKEDQETLIRRKARLYAIDAFGVANKLGLGARINTTMQAAFFRIAQILPEDVFLPAVHKAMAKSYGAKGQRIVEMNVQAFQQGMEAAFEVPLPATVGEARPADPKLAALPGEEDLAGVLSDVIEPIMHLQGDRVPVSKIPPDGSFPTGTTKYEKRSIATHVPDWKPDLCIQCGYCAYACPHAAIRTKAVSAGDVQLSEAEFPSLKFKGKGAQPDDRFVVQVFPDDCTGCGVCENFCLGKDRKTGDKALVMVPKYDVLESLRASTAEYLRLPPSPERLANKATVKGVQLVEPLFEFSGACPGCGETPYVKLITQLVGDRMIQANATGCSSIYGGTAPTCPFTKDAKGRGPAWASSLFEDAAEYGLGMRIAVDKLSERAEMLKGQLLAAADTPQTLRDALAATAPLAAQQADEALYTSSKAAEERVIALTKDAPAGTPAAELHEVASYLTEKYVFAVGGDGWAYDIGYGGLDHVVASDKNINLLVMDTEVYSNTGGQRSKATFIGGVAKFAAAGKELHKKDLGLMCMAYRSAYVCSVNFGADPRQALKAIREALSYRGPSLIMAFSTCIEHGIPMNQGPEVSALATDCGYWLNYRYDPRRLAEGLNPLQLDTKKLKKPLNAYLDIERRYRRLADERPEVAAKLFARAADFVDNRFAYYKKLAALSFDDFKRGEL